MKDLLTEDTAFPILVLSALAYILFQDAVREWVNAFTLEDRVVLLIAVMGVLYISLQFFNEGGSR